MRSQMPKMLHIPDEHFHFFELPIGQLTLIADYYLNKKYAPINDLYISERKRSVEMLLTNCTRCGQCRLNLQQNNEMHFNAVSEICNWPLNMNILGGRRQWRILHFHRFIDWLNGEDGLTPRPFFQ